MTTTSCTSASAERARRLITHTQHDALAHLCRRVDGVAVRWLRTNRAATAASCRALAKAGCADVANRVDSGGRLVLYARPTELGRAVAVLGPP